MDLKERNQNMRAFFNRKINEYDDTHAQFMDTKKAIIDNLEGNITKVLDLGAGTGLELIHLYNKYPNVQVTAIDISEKMLERLAQRPFALNVTCICGDFFQTEFGDDYDAVISTSALHHFLPEDKIKLYQKIYNSLTPSGLFINSDKIAASLEEEQACAEDYQLNKDNRPHIDTPLCIETETRLLSETGFTDLEFKPVDKANYRLILARKK